MNKLIKILIVSFSLFLTNVSFADVLVENPYVRAVPPGQTVSGAFMILNNQSDAEIALVKAESDAAKNVELHEHVHKDGMMQMRQVEKISIPSNGQTALKPGGYHVMLIGLTKPISPDDMISITLTFDDGSSQTVKAPVKKIENSMHM